MDVTIDFRSPGAQPPIYLAGSLTSPPWEPQEMSHEDDQNGGLHFYKKVENVHDGEYQYKFRLGPGEWWVLDETAPVCKQFASCLQSPNADQ